MNAKTDHWKYLLFSLTVATVLLFCLEMISCALFYQRHGRYPLALQGNIVAIKNLWLEARAEKQVKQTIEELQKRGLQADKDRGLAPKEIRVKLFKALYSDKGKKVLNKFRREYEETFATLVRKAKKIRSKLCILYIPQDNYKQSILYNRDFYRELAEKYHVDYIDCTKEFLKYPVDWVTLLPKNGHLSRFGNKLIAEKVSEYIEKYTDYRSNFAFQQRPPRFGDLKPNQNRVWNIMPEMPYRVITNTQGLRMNYDLTFPKQKQRILILGDSYTFGPYLPNFHCYPNLLDKKYLDKEIINAGIAGYTITDEVSLFIEGSRYVEPDITILQVLENDIEGLFYFLKNQYDREGRTFTPSQEEIELMQQVSGI
jgi:lysophospholipase L1-like esterase